MVARLFYYVPTSLGDILTDAAMDDYGIVTRGPVLLNGDVKKSYRVIHSTTGKLQSAQGTSTGFVGGQSPSQSIHRSRMCEPNSNENDQRRTEWLLVSGKKNKYSGRKSILCPSLGNLLSWNLSNKGPLLRLAC
jgi:hypothetical protein